MNICFFGVGGVGGYFGALVAKRFGNIHNIYFIARGKHKDAINTGGLVLKKNNGEQIITVHPALCTENVNDLPVCDIIILSVKAYDLENASEKLNRISHDKTIVLPLLNGVDIYDRIRAHLSNGIILPSCVYVATHIESPGVILQHGGSGKIYMGNDPGFPGFDHQSLFTLFSEAGIDFKMEKNVSISIWLKYMFIAAYGLVTATFDKTLGEILDNEELSRTTKLIMGEIDGIARALNISLANDIVETSFQKGRQFPSGAKTSFQRDVESKGKTNESDLFGGTIIRYGQKLGVPTPVTERVYKKLLDNFE
jgi:2-dehydropantoate 2-reductase